MADFPDNVVLKTDEDISDCNWFLNEDDLASNSAIKVPSQKSVKTYADNLAASSTYTDEEAQDSVGNILDDGSNGSVIFYYDDISDKIYAHIDGGTF